MLSTCAVYLSVLTVLFCLCYLCYQCYLSVSSVLFVCVTRVICLPYLCYFSVLAVLFVCVSCLCYLCHLFPSWLTRAESLACCVQCCFKRAERNKKQIQCFCCFLWHIGERLQAQGVWGLSTLGWCGCSELSLSALMCCGQPRSAQRSREISCGRRQSPQTEDPVSHSWLP